MKTGYVTLPLHNGKAPRWLMERMTKLARSIISLMVLEFGREEVVRRLSDPIWFQSLGCLLGFDWHSSGVTTTVTYAIKSGLKGLEGELGIFVAGGKGKHSLLVPEEVKETGDAFGIDAEKIVYASRLSAKVDSVLLQDGYNLYHHVIMYTKDGYWCVIQQGMNDASKTARRYHWLSEKVEDFTLEPHSGIISESKERSVLDITSRKSEDSRRVILGLVKDSPDKILSLYQKAISYRMPARHYITLKDMKPENLKKVLIKTYEAFPRDFESLLAVRGFGPMSLRALALISDIIYGAKPSYEDPVIYSFAHGGKDGYPYRVRRDIYDKSIEVLERAIKSAKLGQREELETLRRLQKYFT
ncbi:MAG: DUF763 domain-containing protein [bacterium]|nr:DUF763 domain-containing protein [bacterium]